MSLNELRQDCAEKRDVYQHAKAMYGEAVRLGLSAWTDMTALRAELEEALLSYYSAHSALHTALHVRPLEAQTHLH